MKILPDENISQTLHIDFDKHWNILKFITFKKMGIFFMDYESATNPENTFWQK
jgi:hypothetical protein